MPSRLVTAGLVVCLWHSCLRVLLRVLLLRGVLLLQGVLLRGLLLGAA